MDFRAVQVPHLPAVRVARLDQTEMVIRDQGAGAAGLETLA